MMKVRAILLHVAETTERKHNKLHQQPTKKFLKVVDLLILSVLLYFLSL